MQLTNEVDWDIADFTIMGIMLLGRGLLIELVMRKVKNGKHRMIVGGSILLMFLLLWVELAVGIFGTPLAGS